MVWFGLGDEEYDRKYSDNALLRRIIPFFSPYKKRMMVVVLFLTLNSLMSGVTPWLSSTLIEYVGRNTGLNASGSAISPSFDLFSVLLIIILFALNFLSWLFNYLRFRNSARVIANVVYDMRIKLFEAVLEQDLSFFDRIPPGKIASRVNSDTNNFGEVTSLFMDTFSSFFVVFILFIPMFIISPLLSYVLLLMIPFVFAIALLFRKSARKRTLLGRRSLSVVNSFVQETMSGIQIAKTFRQEQKLYDQFLKINKQAYKVNLNRALLLNVLFPAMTLIQGIFLALIIYNGGNLIYFEGFTAAELYLFIQSLWGLFFPIFSLASFWPQYQSGLAAVERIISLFDAPLNVKQTDDKILDIKEGAIDIENLTFSYAYNVNASANSVAGLIDGQDAGEKGTQSITNDTDENDSGSAAKIFDHFTLNIKPGESLAIVGHTGAGKSTLAKILGRFYEFQEGTIKIDGVDIRELNLTHYRSQIGFISQTPFLWADTLRNNLKYGKEDASEEEIIRALDAAGGADWVFDLPNGLDTNINERGKLLSMGQRQLVAFARIILNNPRILILDEATASVDPFTETRIQEALENIMKNRTIIIIAHRLWTVRHVDRIVVLDHGKIIEQGNHEQLMKKEGYYAFLYNLYFKHQSYEYIEQSKRL